MEVINSNGSSQNLEQKPRNIVICCDGTNNEYEKNNTNVVLLFQALVRDQRQLVFYDPGLGTFSILGRHLFRKIGKKLGGAFAYGLSKNLEDAYSFLMNHYEEGDRVFLFGFSRGAFTVRALAGMLYKCGLLPKGANNLVQYVTKTYNKRKNDRIARGFKATFCRPCKPHFIGVWDTVKSLGSLKKREFLDETLNKDISFGYHAVSLDEQRAKFQVSLWDEKKATKEQTISQVWFPGVHSDVGGSYKERGLSDGALKWMAERAVDQDLLLQSGWEKAIGLKPNPGDKKSRHYSRKKHWRLWPPKKRDIEHPNLNGELHLHKSVEQRRQAHGDNWDPSRNTSQSKIIWH